MFLHAWTGCDTTSSIFGHGKTSQQQAAIFQEENAPKDEVIKAGEKCFLDNVWWKGGRQFE